MAHETIMWTVLPNGSEEQTLKFSLYLSPQLAVDGHLEDFPHFKDWTERAQHLSVSLEIDGRPPLPATLKLDVLQQGLWTTLFPPKDTRVKGHVFKDQSTRTIQSFPVSRTNQTVLNLYNQAASKTGLATEHPTLSTSNAVSTFIESMGGPMRRLLEARQLHLGKDPNNTLLDTLAKEINLSAELRPLYEAWRFYNRPQGTAGADYVVKSPPIPDWEFHEVVAMLVDHGKLLRLLGLVIDGTLTVPTGTTIPAKSKIRVESVKFNDESAATVGCLHPWTHFLHSPSSPIGFMASPTVGGEIVNQMLRLENNDMFATFEVDADGAALKTLDFAVNLKRFQDKTSSQKADRPERAALPALRTGGITVARIARGNAVKATFARAKLMDADRDNAELRAEDLTRGYRVDVLSRGRWYSLCQREGQVLVGPPANAVAINVKDEGYVKGASGSSSLRPGVTVDELYLHEALFTWKGWSLVASRPGRHIPLLPDTEPVRHANKAGTKYQLVTEFHAAPNTLPRLRFGERYRVRARTVDLAGNSLPLDAVVPGTAWVSPERRYLRYEPVPSPALVPRAMFREGEGLENVAIRTQVEHLHPHLEDALFNQSNERHVLPPKAAQVLAEEHGMFDPLFATDPKLAFRISCKEQGTLLDRQIVDPYDGAFDPAIFPAKLVDVTDIALVNPTVTPPVEIPASDSANWPVHRGDPLPVPSAYVIHKGKTVALPYLPDPLARGLALRFPDGTVQFQPFAGTWPNAKPFLLELASGPLAYTAMADGSVRITLPKGTMLPLRYSSLIDAAGLDVLAFGQNLSSALSGLATLGQHWMLTPYREVNLVHAVEQPVEDPKIKVLSPSKERGKTYVALRGTLKTHSQSTGIVDVRASWTDPVDRLTDAEPTTEYHEGLAFSRKLGYAETLAPVPSVVDQNTPEPPRHEFGDTKHRKVTYWCVGTTRYREYFPPTLAADPANITRVGPKYAPVNILSSARPDVPRVLYVLPTFGWDISNDGHTRKRVGRGLRIYLDRPWYSSGDGEKLGILLAHTPISPTDMDPIRPYVSEWGVDPATDDVPPTSELLASQFTNQAMAPLDNVAVAEKTDLRVQVLGFAVEYNRERKLWFCDIQMDPGNYYYPFVRLAIVRVQPDSVTSPEDLRLSRVVKTEFAQLTADRTATITPSANGVAVSVSGLTAKNDAADLLRETAKAASPVATEAANLHATSIPQPLQGFRLSPKAGAGHRVVVQLERRPATKPKRDGKTRLGWELVGHDVDLDSYTLGVSPEVFWRGTVPWGTLVSGYDYRLVIREFELHRTDIGLGERDLPDYNTDHVSIAQRLVYLDIIPVSY